MTTQCKTMPRVCRSVGKFTGDVQYTFLQRGFPCQSTRRLITVPARWYLVIPTRFRSTSSSGPCWLWMTVALRPCSFSRVTWQRPLDTQSTNPPNGVEFLLSPPFFNLLWPECICGQVRVHWIVRSYLPSQGPWTPVEVYCCQPTSALLSPLARMCSFMCAVITCFESFVPLS